MAKSLQEQLLGAGVANKKQAANAKKARNKKIKQRKSGEQIEDTTTQRLQEEQALKLKKDRELNRQRDEAAEQKAITAQIKQIIEHSRLSRPDDSEVRFNFTDGSAVKYLHVSEEQRQHLTKGFLAIARLPTDYELIPGNAAKKIVQRDKDTIVVWHIAESSSSTQTSSDDDPYAAYEVPDDLVW